MMSLRLHQQTATVTIDSNIAGINTLTHHISMINTQTGVVQQSSSDQVKLANKMLELQQQYTRMVI